MINQSLGIFKSPQNLQFCVNTRSGKIINPANCLIQNYLYIYTSTKHSRAVVQNTKEKYEYIQKIERKRKYSNKIFNFSKRTFLSNKKK